MKRVNELIYAGIGITVAGTMLLSTTGCREAEESAATPAPVEASADTPVFSLAWSEYPSWSVFGVADLYGMIDGEEGKLGPIEEKHGVDLVLIESDYDTCITLYATGEADAVCITNMDILNPAMSRRAVAVLPTSTSNGADALIVTGIDSVEALRGKPVYGLEASVSQYTFVRNLELLGEDTADHAFTNMDPAAAAQAMITGQAGYDAIVVWNPFVLETLKKRQEASVLFDSSSIPGEIVDLVAFSAEALEREGGEAAARAICEAFYALNEKLADPETGDEALVALGSKFSSLELDEMKEVVVQTDFYESPEAGIDLFGGDELKETMSNVVRFCQSYGILDDEPKVGYGDNTVDAHLTFTTKYMSPGE
ncbi:MAG: hypothetical protein AAGF84_04720 [Planctomycetota bacterium]